MSASTKFEPVGLRLTVRTVGATLIIEAEGEIDLATAPLLEEALDAGMVAGCQHAVVDVCEIAFLDAAGFNAIISTFGCDAQHSLRVRNPSHRVRRFLELADRCDLIEELTSPSAPVADLGPQRVGRRSVRQLMGC